MSKKFLIPLAVAAMFLMSSATASAEMRVAGTGEPQFTRSDNNTQWVEWSAHNYDSYALRVTYLRDGVQVAQQTTGPVAAQGKIGFDWTGVLPLPLEQGRSYAICVMGVAKLGGITFDDSPDSCANGDTVGKRTATTIDRSKPEVSVELADGAASAEPGSLPLSITYSDTQSQAFPANFLCFGSGADMDAPCGEGDVYGYSAPCSNAVGAGLTTTFECAVDSSAANPDDGRFWACITSADSSVPDNPTSADQIRTAEAANLSEKKCDSVDLISAACTSARSALDKAKAKLKKLKQNGASKQKFARAKARLKDAKAAESAACA